MHIIRATLPFGYMRRRKYGLSNSGQSLRRLFAGCPGPDGQSVDAAAGDVAERGVDHALALESGHAGESHALDGDGEVRFAAAIVASVAVVAGAVVNDFEAGRRKLCGEQPCDFLGEGFVHVFSSSASLAI